MSENCECTKTKEKLLEAARELFAQKGYLASSVSEITKLADANKAAINYYFGSKDKLYEETWHKEFIKAVEKHPIDDGISQDATPKERLRGYIRALSRRVADPENLEFDIVKHEHASPTGLLIDVMKNAIDPVHAHLEGIVRELLGPKANDKEVQLCCTSVTLQCIHMCLRKRPGRGIPHRPPLEGSIEEIAEHIFVMSYTGIIELRNRIEKTE